MIQKMRIFLIFVSIGLFALSKLMPYPLTLYL